MKKLNWQIVLAVILIISSALFYFIHYLVFNDPHHIFIYLVGDIAFVPLEVLLVTIILHKILAAREKKALLEKLNMVIGAFFSEAGTALLRNLSSFDPKAKNLSKELIIKHQWKDEDFNRVKIALKDYSYRADTAEGNLPELKVFLSEKRNFLLQLIENPNLLEHDLFTDLLWAVFHLIEELEARTQVEKLEPDDARHIEGDIKRAYGLLVKEWLDYMKHLKNSYPYLFSLAMRTNPFNPDASPVVKG